MNRTCGLSNVTKDYLATYCCILEEMMQGMKSVDLRNSISHNFIVQMIPHHQWAIEMARNILRYTTNIPLQKIATQIIIEQTKSIDDMQRILCACSAQRNCKEDLCRYQNRIGQIMKTMFCEMKYACTNNCVSANFIREMIPHHLGAIAMAENTLKYVICPELVAILDEIITSQKMEVEKMQCILHCM